MPSPGDLALQGEALEALLAGVHADAVVASRGEPDCGVAILIRPVEGERVVTGAGACVCETRWVVHAVVRLDCPLDEAQAIVYGLMSACGDGSIPRRLKPNQKSPTALGALGAAVHRVEPPVGFGLTQYKTDGPPNAYAAQVQVLVRYEGC